MGIIINDATEKMQSGEKITFDSLDFIVDWFGDLNLQEPESSMEEQARRNLSQSVHSLPDWRKLWMLGPVLLPNT